MEETQNSAKYDHVRQSVVILMGSMAKHLAADDSKGRHLDTFSFVGLYCSLV